MIKHIGPVTIRVSRNQIRGFYKAGFHAAVDREFGYWSAYIGLVFGELAIQIDYP